MMQDSDTSVERKYSKFEVEKAHTANLTDVTRVRTASRVQAGVSIRKEVITSWFTMETETWQTTSGACLRNM